MMQNLNLGKQLPLFTYKENRDILAIWELNFRITFYGQMWPPFICPLVQLRSGVTGTRTHLVFNRCCADVRFPPLRLFSHGRLHSSSLHSSSFHSSSFHSPSFDFPFSLSSCLFIVCFDRLLFPDKFHMKFAESFVI